MATQPLTKAVPAATGSRRRTPPELNILAVLLGIALIFELLGWILIGQSFLFNGQRLLVMILQVSVIGIIAISAHKLTTKSIGKDKLLWGIFTMLAAVTIITESESAFLFLAAGALVWVVRSRLAGRRVQPAADAE